MTETEDCFLWNSVGNTKYSLIAGLVTDVNIVGRHTEAESNEAKEERLFTTFAVMVTQCVVKWQWTRVQRDSTIVKTRMNALKCRTLGATMCANP